MTLHTLVFTETDPNHHGFFRRYYAIIDIEMSGPNWVWQQLDVSGNVVGKASGPFESEDAAKDDALKKLHGDEWEVRSESGVWD